MAGLSSIKLILQVYKWWKVAVVASTIVVSCGFSESAAAECFPALFQFGDSLSDTGNVEALYPTISPAAFLPYGRTAFHKPADRYSDGRLVIDFLAQAINLPFINPYLKSIGTSFTQGVNFAVGGATIHNSSFFEKNNISMILPYSLLRQVDWYLRFKANVVTTYNSTGWQNQLPNLSAFAQGLHVIGEIGGNDYSFAFEKGLSTERVSQMVPSIIEVVESSIQSLYSSGARNFLVVNLPPAGCTPYYLSIFVSNASDYDEMGCLSSYNNVITLHNNMLKSSIMGLRKQLFNATLLYADFEGIFKDVYKNPHRYGISTTQTACCGGGKGQRTTSIYCGQTKITPCSNPSEYFYWDQVHPTENFNRINAIAYLSGQYLDPPYGFRSRCYLNYQSLYDSIK
ncbi:hypothetical protein O6H91_02G058600 [Diphasiastrum complanatum]|uniref:Uncharacterized protein n=1 Tax=Diphasiastrum complanatum TaxID=34168 RepID=A0ACC2EFZ2_DIPCM|nr:hypothetical protein O6H91_02G058600 [Diphasiastrum complanatum]